MTLRFAPCQEVSTKLPDHVNAYLQDPVPDDRPAISYLEEMSAFVTETGALGLWDGESAWLSVWGEDKKTTHLRAGDARYYVQPPLKPPVAYSTPRKGGPIWTSGLGEVQSSTLEGPEQSNGLVPAAYSVAKPGPSPHALRSIQVGEHILALLCADGKARAFLWRLPTTWPTDLSPPAGYHFTGEMLRVPFAKSWDGKTIIEADIFGLRDAAGLWSSAYRFWLGGQLCSLSHTSPTGEVSTPLLFTFGQGVPRRHIPFVLDNKGPNGGKMHFEYVLIPGYITTNAIDTIELDLTTGHGHFFHNTWEEH